MSREWNRCLCAPRAAKARHGSRIVGCKQHNLDPELYLAEIIRIMPCWPRDRHLQLAPAYWAQTRARPDPFDLDAELGFITMPPVGRDAASRRRRAEVARSVTQRLSRQQTGPSRTGSTLQIPKIIISERVFVGGKIPSLKAKFTTRAARR